MGTTGWLGYQANIRQKVIETLKGWGGELVEFPYTHTATEETLSTLDQLLSLPETRRGLCFAAACCNTSRACPRWRRTTA